MAILVEGIDMPKHDDEYVIFTVYGDGGVVYGPLNRPHVRYKNRAVPVPEPHGRLIDADALAEDLKRQCEEVFKIDAVSPDDFWITRDQAYNERLWKTWCESFYKYLESRPTVIPASGGG